MVTQKKKTKIKPYDRYVECPACGMVVHNPHYKLTRLDEPAPCCGASGQPRTRWPSLEVHKFLEIVGSQELNSDDERRVAIVFLCSALELLLEHSPWRLLAVHTNSRQLADFVLENTRGRERRIRLYTRLSDCPLGDLLKARGMLTFLDDWNQISELRNDIVHGQYFSNVENEADLIRNVHANCLKVFAEVHNDVQRMIRENAIKAEEIVFEEKEREF